MARLLETDRTIMNKKAVTIQEAIKANEHSRVRISGFNWFDVGELKASDNFHQAEILADWEIEAKPLELWVNVYPNGRYSAPFDSKEVADLLANIESIERIRCAKMREVTDD